MNRATQFAIVVFCVSLTVYALTLCPTIFWEDSAAFAAAAHTLGIPHSPGFPIYILLGRIFSFFPAQNPAWSVNFMSAFWGSASLALLYLLLIKLLKRRLIPDLSDYLISATFVLFFGFTTSFWSQTFRAEVYTLNLFFTISLVFLLWKWSESKEAEPEQSKRYFLLFAFLWGLGAANHSLLVISLAPAFLIFILASQPKFLLKVYNLSSAIFFGILGITPYLFLLIRSQQNPALNWGKPDTWANLWKVITKSSTWNGSLNISHVDLWNNLVQIIQFLSSDLLLPVLVLAILGAVILFQQGRRIWILLTGVFFCNILIVTWAAEFSIRNLDLLGYLLPALLVLTLFAASGMKWIFDLARNRFPLFQPRPVASAAATILIILPAYQLVRNYSSSDYSQNNFVYAYGKNILEQVPTGSVIIAADDNTLTPLWYLTLVEKHRPDVTALAWSALDNLDYLKMVKHQHFVLKIPAGLEKSSWVEQFARMNPQIPLYLQYVELPQRLERHLLPQKLLLKYYPDPTVYPPSRLSDQLNFLNSLFSDLKSGPRLDPITKEHYGDCFFNWGAYFDRHSFPEQSFLNFDRAIQLDSTNDRYYTMLGKAFLKSGRADLARKFFEAALELNPYRDENQRYLSLCQDSLNRSQEQTLP